MAQAFKVAIVYGVWGKVAIVYGVWGKVAIVYGVLGKVAIVYGVFKKRLYLNQGPEKKGVSDDFFLGANAPLQIAIVSK